MYKTIYVPVDNSEHSNQAMAHGVAVGQKFGSQMIGCHVYAAKMHDYRFKQMEYTLPDEYLDEVELDRQRKIHDSLITMGLELISDSYLAQMDKLCKETGLEFIPKMMDGKHHVEILKDIEESAYDLTVIGAVGIGRVKDSVIGSVCERVARHADKDVWVVKELPADKTDEHDTILVGVDGSPQSFGALMTAIKLAGHFNKKIEVISVYDPYLHYSVFNGIVNILTDKAAKVFRFEEQNQLHEEIIDTGLAEIYQSHLEVAKKMASDEGVEVSKTLLDGKAYQKILDHARKTKPWLLVVGRVGVHSSEEENGLGSNSENLLRLSPCDVLLTTSLVRPELDVKADESIRWTPEAEERMTRVPDQVRGVARTAILRLAMEKGHSVISSDVLDDAMDRYMPKSTSNLTERLAGALAVEQAARANMAMCKSCGVTARDANPVRCTVCDGTTFEIITQEMLERIAEVEGGLMEEVTYDGRKLKWSQDSKKALWTMKDAYQRRRAKARVEKTARIRKMSVITLDFARDIIEEETGLKIDLPRTAVEMSDAVESETLASPGGDKKLIARDAKKHPLFSHLDWSPEAIERILRVPHGYMRENTQGRIESMLDSRGDRRVEIADVEQGIELGAALMKEMIDNLESQAATAAAESSTDTDKAADYGINPKTIVKRNEDAGPALNEVGVTQRLMNMADDDGSVH